MGTKYSICFRPAKFKKNTLHDAKGLSYLFEEEKRSLEKSQQQNVYISSTTDGSEATNNLPQIDYKLSDANDLQATLNQLFIFCETGQATHIHYVLETTSNLENCVNDRHVCYVSNTYMELTPLQLAAACGHGNVIMELLAYPTILCNIPEPLHLMTALHIAVSLGQIGSIKALCHDARVDINAKNIDGKTALHLAVELEDVRAIEAIFRERPNVDLRIKDFDGNNALHFAAFYPNEKILNLLLCHAAGQGYYCPWQTGSPRISLDRIQSKRIFFAAINSDGETALSLLKKLIAGQYSSSLYVSSPTTRTAVTTPAVVPTASESPCTLPATTSEGEGVPAEKAIGEVVPDASSSDSKLSQESLSPIVQLTPTERPSEALMSSLRATRDKDKLVEKAGQCLALLMQTSYIPSSTNTGLDTMTTFGCHTSETQDGLRSAESRGDSRESSDEDGTATAFSWSPRTEMLLNKNRSTVQRKYYASPLSIQID